MNMTDPAVSIVVPVRNEAGNIAPLVEEVAAAVDGQWPFEVICVNDGSTDATGDELRQLMARYPWLRRINHKRSCGQSAAVRSGVAAARAPLVVTLDGDGQNDPAFIPALIRAIETGSTRTGLVAGQRVGRKTSGFKKFQSRVANVVRSAVLRDGTRDTGCGLKAFRRDVFLSLPYFDGLHRFQNVGIYTNYTFTNFWNGWLEHGHDLEVQSDNLTRGGPLMTQQGGWPMSVWLTPDLRPFYAGTYFPPDDRFFGRPGFRTLCLELARAWRERRAEVEATAADVTAAIRRYLVTGRAEGRTAPEREADLARQAVRQFERDFDPVNGGFGDAPKFPPSQRLALLLRVYSGHPAAEIASTEPRFVDAVGLKAHLSPTRSNGLAAMLQRIRAYADEALAGTRFT